MSTPADHGWVTSDSPPPQGNVTPVWIPSGIILAFVLIRGG